MILGRKFVWWRWSGVKEEAIRIQSPNFWKIFCWVVGWGHWHWQCHNMERETEKESVHWTVNEWMNEWRERKRETEREREVTCKQSQPSLFLRLSQWAESAKPALSISSALSQLCHELHSPLFTRANVARGS